MDDIVIIGAGQAGASLAAKLRTLGHAGKLTLIGAEPEPPYQRPPLSKGYLLGEMALQRLYLRSADFWREQGVTLRLGAPVTGIDLAARRVSLGDEVLEYGQLALTMGARPRHLPAAIGGALEGVHTVRSLADVDAMAAEFRAGAKVLIVGGGYIGLEAASVAAKLGLEVTLVEAAERILQRVAAPETSDWFRALHLAHGVRLIEGTGLARLTGAGRVSGAVLADGREIGADFVIVGVGIEPDCGLAGASGLALDNGIRCDEMGRTSDASVWAAGDCASFPWKGRRIRLESVGNAIDMAEAVAANMLGAGAPYRAQPWFWSDQYDAKLQIAGLNAGYDRIVTRPAPVRADAGPAETTPRSFWYFRGAELLAVDALNDARAYMIGKRMLEMGINPDLGVIADPEANLKALLK